MLFLGFTDFALLGTIRPRRRTPEAIRADVCPAAPPKYADRDQGWPGSHCKERLAVKQHFFGTTFAILLLGCLAGTSHAQPGPQGGGAAPAPAAQGAPANAGRTMAGGPVAVVDLLFIFENHSVFTERKNALQRDKERIEAEFLGVRDELKAIGDKLKDFKPGTKDYNEYEAAYVKAEAEAKAKVQLANKEFMTREGKMYYQTYQEVLEEIKWYAERAGITIVLRYDGKPVDPEDPQDIVKEMTEMVVYYNKATDITHAVLAQINSHRPQPRQAAQPQRPGVPGAAAPARPR
jgi:Skp family chaperone for outer membrane proteins